jgi:hypothetical protein
MLRPIFYKLNCLVLAGSEFLLKKQKAPDPIGGLPLNSSL